MSWIQGLNPEQALAVQHNEGPMLILAGAGSGKTTVLVSRTGRMIQEELSRPENMLVLTFTNKAARELKHRVQAKLGNLGNGLPAGTFHSFGLGLLRKYHHQAGLPNYFGIMDQSDSQSVLRELLRDIRVGGKDKFDLEHLLNLVNTLRIKQRFGHEAKDEYHDLAEIVLPKYLKKLELMGSVDFEGLLLKPIELMQKNPNILQEVQNQYQHVMVDEFQDTNQLQMELIDMIVKNHRNITVVGDDDQSIYGWRGAEVRNILDFPKRYKPCEVVRLERNYRSTPAILTMANEVIQKNKTRHGKILKAEGSKAPGELPEVFVLESEDEETEFVVREIRQNLDQGRALKDIAILYRSNSQGGMIESVLRENRIAYTVSGATGFFDRKEIKDVLAYLRFAFSPNDVSLRRIINTPPRGLGDTTVEKLSEYSKVHRVNFVKACRDWRNAGVSENAGAAIENLFQFGQGLIAKILGPQPGANLLQILRDLGYRDYIFKTASKSEEGDKRWTWVEIFSRILDSFCQKGGANAQSIREFVDAMELRDQPDDEDKNKLSLMTLHACKGLEFPVVMLLGVEEDLLPHKTLGSDVDEERRLFYVGLTRAKQKLLLTRCKSRKRYGVTRPVTPSRFLLEIPHNLYQAHNNGYRPVSAGDRENLVANFLANLQPKPGKI